MARDQSNDEAGSTEPVTELPAQEYFLPNRQDGLKLASDVSVQGNPVDEPPSEPPAEENFLPNRQDGLELKSDGSKQGFPGDEPPSEPPAQEHLVSENQEGLKLEFVVSNERERGDKPPSELPAHKHVLSKSQEGQDSSVFAVVQTVIDDDDDDQTAVSFPLSTTFRPVNMVLEERSYSPQPNGLVQESGEQRPTAGRSRSQQPQLGNLKKPSGYSWQANDVSQTRDAAAKNSSSFSDQRRANLQATHPNDPSVGQSVVDQGSRNNGPSPTFNTRSHERSVLSSMQTTQVRAESEAKYQQDHSKTSQAVSDQAPLNIASGTTFDTPSHKRKASTLSQMTPPPSSEIPSSHWNQERLPPIENIILPPNSGLANPRLSRWDSQRKHPWVGYLPDINESRRFESQDPQGRPRRLVQGPTQPPGPPLKPFDGPIYEEKAQERRRRDHE